MLCILSFLPRLVVSPSRSFHPPPTLNSPLPSEGRSRSRRQVSGRGSIGQWQYVYYSGAGLYDDCFYFRPFLHLTSRGNRWIMRKLTGVILRMTLLFDRDKIEHKLCSVLMNQQNKYPSDWFWNFLGSTKL